VREADNLPPYSADVKKSRSLNSPRPLWACMACNGCALPFSSKFWFYNYLKSRSAFVFTLYIIYVKLVLSTDSVLCLSNNKPSSSTGVKESGGRYLVPLFLSVWPLHASERISPCSGRFTSRLMSLCSHWRGNWTHSRVGHGGEEIKYLWLRFLESSFRSYSICAYRLNCSVPLSSLW
jgi:hypothetical protein